MKTVTLPAETFDAMVRVLVKLPFENVSALMASIQAQMKVSETPSPAGTVDVDR